MLDKDTNLMPRSEARGVEKSDTFREQLVAALPRLRAFARMLTRNAEQADDLVHDTLVRAMGAEDKFQSGTNLHAWLLTILRNQHISNLRRRRFEAEPIDDIGDSALPTPPRQVSAVELGELREALVKMSVQHREALLLIAAAGLTYEEAAEVCKCAVGTMKSRMNRARLELRRLLSERSARPAHDYEVAAAAF